MMKPEIKRFDKDFNQLVEDIPVDQLRKMYHDWSYDSQASLWIKNDLETFKRKEREIEKLLNRMTRQQQLECLNEEIKIHADLLFDLRMMLRSEAIEGISSIFSYNWLIGSIQDNLETYKGTNDEYWVDSALDLCNRILNPFYEKYWNAETVSDIQSYLERMEKATELTDEDKDGLTALSDWVRFYNLHQELKTNEKGIND